LSPARARLRNTLAEAKDHFTETLKACADNNLFNVVVDAREVVVFPQQMTTMKRVEFAEFLARKFGEVRARGFEVFAIRKVALWLGHSSTQSKEIYVRADPSEKLEALVTITPPTLRRGRFTPPDKLLALLRPER
jgi:hypothetical protein